MSELGEIEAAIWRELVAAVDDRDHEWHTPVLASAAIGGEGEVSPDARTVVLRAADPQAQQLIVYTDSRSPKVSQLQATPVATLVFWSRRLSWQLRCQLHCDVAEEGLAVSSHWARIKLTRAAQDYLSPLPPGAPIGSAPPAAQNREHFALLNGQVLAIDWLELAGDGHRRARFADGMADWLQP
ncbi:pyridoxamine 5'-phosphate oxidase [Piscinibacter sakaiensis]|uniref:pyridoxamine 5'-phosphate oxidase n=1 Tax=Piscinibacter sakaiensis TaxID=1547922 RepID=UPI003AAC0ECC